MDSDNSTSTGYQLEQLEESYINSSNSTVQNNILLTASSLFDI